MKNLNNKTEGENKKFSVSKKAAALVAGLALAGTFSANTYAITDAMKIRISNCSYSDEAVVRFLPNATDNFDSNCDSWKLFSPNGAVPNIFTKSDSGNPLSINAMPSFTTARKVSLYARIQAPGYYLIKGEEIGAFAKGACIMLRDMSTGQLFDLRSGKTYLINLPSINENSSARFEIILIPASSLQVSPTTCSSCNDGKVMIKKPGYKNWEYFINNAGGVVSSGIASDDTVTVPGLAAGTYTLTTYNEYGTTEIIPVSIEHPAVTEVITYNRLSGVNIWSEGNTCIVEADLNTSSDLSLNLYDLTGKSLSHTELKNVSSIHQEIDMTGLSAGIYLVVASSNGLLMTKKLIKTN